MYTAPENLQRWQMLNFLIPHYTKRLETCPKCQIPFIEKTLTALILEEKTI